MLAVIGTANRERRRRRWTREPDHALKLCLGRKFELHRSKGLISLYQEQLDNFRTDAAAATKMAVDPSRQHCRMGLRKMSWRHGDSVCQCATEFRRRFDESLTFPPSGFCRASAPRDHSQQNEINGPRCGPYKNEGTPSPTSERIRHIRRDRICRRARRCDGGR